MSGAGAIKPESDHILDRPMGDTDGIDFEIIELLFFAYRDFVGDADEALAKFGFGRAHHRVVHFVTRNPGIKVADLLDILNITKQSLGRVIKDLEAREMLVTRPGNRDRRQKELRLTPAGRAVEAAVFGQLRDAMSRAYTHAGQAAVTGFWQVNEALMSPRERQRVARLGSES